MTVELRHRPKRRDYSRAHSAPWPLFTPVPRSPEEAGAALAEIIRRERPQLVMVTCDYTDETETKTERNEQ